MSLKPQKKWIYLAVCFFMPAIAGLIRKLMPGQPNWVEPAANTLAIALTLFFVFTSIKKRNEHVSPWLTHALLLWAVFQFIYLVPAMFYNFKMAGLALCVRILPLLMTYIAFHVITSANDLKKIATFLGWFTMVMLPFSIYGMIFGNKSLPVFLQPISRMVEIGKGSKGGFETCALIFNTEVTLAFSFLAILFIIVAASRGVQKKEAAKYWLFELAAFFLIYISTQRGAFFIACGGILIQMLYLKNKYQRQIIGGFILVVVIMFSVDRFSKPDTQYQHVGSRSKLAFTLDLKERFNSVFLGITLRWIDLKPFGTFLGFAGLENSIFGSNAPKPMMAIETGAAMLVAEMGIAALVFMPILIISISIKLLKQSKSILCYPTILMLVCFMFGYFLLFFFKYAGTLLTLNMAQIIFWAIPGICAKTITLEMKQRTTTLSSGVV